MRVLILVCLLLGLTIPAHAEYKGNFWASWASVSTQITWTFPFKTREINVQNGSTTPICVSFNGAPITQTCTSPALTNGDQKVFQVGANQLFLLQDFITSSITMQSASVTAASPISVIVTY